MDKNVAAYFAGILDGNGSIVVKRRLDPTTIYEYALCVSICNKSEMLMKFLVDAIGGSYKFWVKTGKDESRGSYVWTMGNKKILPILEECLPFSKTKKKHVDLAIQYINTLGAGNIPLTPEVLELRGAKYIR
jgi:hypothetical protein